MVIKFQEKKEGILNKIMAQNFLELKIVLRLKEYTKISQEREKYITPRKTTAKLQNIK